MTFFSPRRRAQQIVHARIVRSSTIDAARSSL
jgi:hypothetical protein